MPHAHQYRVTFYLLLTVPDSEQFADRVTRWGCDCGAYILIDGNVRVGTPLYTPAFWDALSRNEQRAGTPEAREAYRQNRWRVR